MAQPKGKKKNSTGIALLSPEESIQTIDWNSEWKKYHEQPVQNSPAIPSEPEKKTEVKSLPGTYQEYLEQKSQLETLGASEAPIVKHNSDKAIKEAKHTPDVSQIVINTPVTTPVTSSNQGLQPPAETVSNNPQNTNTSGTKTAQQVISSGLFDPNLDVPQLYKKLQAIKQVFNNGIVGGIYYNKTW